MKGREKPAHDPRRRHLAGGLLGWLTLPRDTAAAPPGMTPAPASVPLRVAMIQMDPWGLRDDGDIWRGAHFAGIVPDLLDALERRSGLLTRRVLTPYARVEAELASGFTDCSVLAWSEHRAAYAIRGCELLWLDFGVLPLKSTGPLARLEDVLALRVALPRGLRVSAEFDAEPRIYRYPVLDYAMAVRMAAMHRGVQAVAGSLGSIRAAAQRLGLADHFGSGLVLGRRPVTLSFSRASAALAQFDRVDAVLHELTADGTVQRLVDRWMPGG